MKSLRIAALLACWSAASALAIAADDTIKKIGEPQIKCSISSIDKNEVKYEKGGKQETVPTYEIESIRLAGEPAQLNLIRNQANNGAYENALKSLDKINADTLEDKPEVKAEVQFLRVYCHGRLALGGSGDVKEAGKQLKAFIDANPNSYHFYPANELAGDMLVQLGNYEAATTFYHKLAEAPANAYKIRAGIDTGRAKLAEKKYPDALKEFETALELAEKDKAPEAQKLSAMLGKASCLAQTGKPEEGVKLAETVISKLPTEEADLHSWGYVVLGNCYRQMPNHAKQALLAYLHVDVLYFSNPQWHAEALWNLASLWQELKKIDRATQSSALLKERYPNSPWAKM
jgi:tetratricopeptide (TPR) repeat protein